MSAIAKNLQASVSTVRTDANARTIRYANKSRVLKTAGNIVKRYREVFYKLAK